MVFYDVVKEHLFTSLITGCVMRVANFLSAEQGSC